MIPFLKFPLPYNISTGVEIFPPKYTYFNRGINISTEVEIFPPWFKYLYTSGNLYTITPVEILLPPRMKKSPVDLANIATSVDIFIP